MVAWAVHFQHYTDSRHQGHKQISKKHHGRLNFLTLSLINMRKYFPGLLVKVVIIHMEGPGVAEEPGMNPLTVHYIQCHWPSLKNGFKTL